MKTIYFVNWGPDTRHLNRTQSFDSRADALDFARELPEASKVTSLDFPSDWSLGENEQLIAEVIYPDTSHAKATR